jgi:hypothetical protein
VTYFLLKTLISALAIAGISELAKRYGWFASILASLPLTSILAMVWLYHDTRDVEKVSRLSIGVFWMVVPSLGFFLILPVFLRHLPFAMAMILSCAAMALFYLAYGALLAKWGIRI